MKSRFAFLALFAVVATLALMVDPAAAHVAFAATLDPSSLILAVPALAVPEATAELLTRAAGTIERVATDQKAAGEKITEIERRNTELDARTHAIEQLMVQIQQRGEGTPISTPGGSIGSVIREKFIQTDALTDFRKRGVSTGSVDLGLSIRALVSAGNAGSSNDGTYDVQAQRVPGLFGYGARELTLFAALPVIQTTTNAIEGHRLDGFTAAAAAQTAEGVEKQEQEIDTTLVRWPVSTIAVHMRASRQVLDDDATLQGMLVNLLGHTVVAKAERDAIYGDGSAGEMKGIHDDATAYVPTDPATTAEDQIGDAMATMAANGYQPSLIVMNPRDWRKVQRRKSAVEGLYLMGSPAAPIPPTLWGLPVVVTAAMNEGDALVIDTRYCLLLDRQAVTAFVGFEDADNLRKNLATILVEGRWGVALFDSWAAYKLDIAEPVSS